MGQEKDILTTPLNTQFLNNKEILASYSEDFGHLIKSDPLAIASPKNTEEIQEVIKYAAASNLSLTTRGLGRSQSGQSIPFEKAITLDLSLIKDIRDVDLSQKTIISGAGTTWKDVIQKTLPHGLIPPAMPLNLNLTIGGTLSIGGIGTSSHKAGVSAANVKSLEVIESKGKTINCDKSANSEYYNAALSNLGRCVIIGSAELELKKVKPNIRTFYLLYDDIRAWVNDQRLLVQRGRVDHLQGSCSANIQGLRKGEAMYNPFVHWFYGLQVSFEFDAIEDLPSSEELLRDLNYYKVLHYEDDTIYNFSTRFEARFELMKKTGVEYQAHPWIECVLPANVIADLLPEVLKILPVWLGDGHRLIFVNKKNAPQFFKTPDSDENAVFAILPTGVAPLFVEDTLKVLARVHHMLTEAGGKRYLSGWLKMMDRPAWKNHYGNQFEEWISIKKKLDPTSLFQNKLFGDLEL